MSGAYSSRDTTAAAGRMGFSARRLAPATAAANELGRVSANPKAVANTVGNIVDTATPQSVDADGEAIDGLFNNGNCFSTDNGKIVFTPPTEISVGFEYRLKYTTAHRIVSRTRLKGFDTVYLGPGAEFRFELANRYRDLREAVAPNFTYRALVFDHLAGAQYRLTYTRNGVPGTVWTDFAARSAQVTTPASGTVVDPVLARPQRFAVGRLPRRLGALQRLRRRDGARRTVEAAAPHGRRERFARIAQVFQSDLLRGGGARDGADPAQGVLAAAALPLGSGIRVADRIRRCGAAPHPAVGTARCPCASVRPPGSAPRRRRGGSGSSRKGSFSVRGRRRTGAAGRTFRSLSSGGRSPRRFTRCGRGGTGTATARWRASTPGRRLRSGRGVLRRIPTPRCRAKRCCAIRCSVPR